MVVSSRNHFVLGEFTLAKSEYISFWSNIFPSYFGGGEKWICMMTFL